MPKHRKQDVEARIELLAGTPAPFEDSRRVVVLKNSDRHCTLRATRPEACTGGEVLRLLHYVTR